MDTLLQIAELPATVTGLLKKMVDQRIHLDLNLNQTLTLPVMKMVANTTSLLIITFSSNMAKALMIPDIYSKLTDQADEELRNLGTFLKRFAHPIEELANMLGPFSSLLSQAAFSATKILERAEGQATNQMQNLLISQEGLQTPDEIYNNNAGMRDILDPFQLARWAFLTFLVSGMPWELKNKDDMGTKLLRAILSNGWLTNLFRDHMLNYQTTITEILKRGKDKGKAKKIAEIKKWEEVALNSAANTRKNKRLMLALLLEDYCTLFEDQQILIGPRILMILTLLAHATSEINWLVVHQNGVRKKKENESSLYTGQETITILYYLTKMRDLIKNNECIIKAYFIEALKLEDTKDVEEMLEQLDLSKEDSSLVKKVLDNIQKIELTENEDGVKVENPIHRYDMGRVITALSSQTQSSSSPMQMSPKLTRQLEIICMHIQLLQDPIKMSRRISNLSFLYFYRDTFEDYFDHLFQMPYSLSYSIAFPMICQDFTSALNRICPEEYDVLISETHGLANSFLDKMAEKTIEQIETYCNEYTLLAKDLVPSKVARIFSEREQEYKKKSETSESEIVELEDQEVKKKRRKTIVHPSTLRKNLFESKIENVTIGMKELLKAFYSRNSITIASYKFFPEAFFLEKLTDKITEKIKGFVHFPIIPSQILLNLSSYHTALLHIDPGLDISTLVKEVMYDLRANDDIVTHTYLTKYKETLFTALGSPHCYYNESMSCFMAMTPKMETQSESSLYTGQETFSHILTSPDEMEALSAIFGVEGLSWLTSQIGENITTSVAKLLHIVKDNSNLLNEPRDKDDTWKHLANIPEFILTAIDIGKKVSLVKLLDQGHENVTKNRVEYLSGVIDMMVNSEMSNLLGVPDTIEKIASAMGSKQAGIEIERNDGGSSQLLVSMVSTLLPFLANLATSRFFPTSTGTNFVLLDVHQNSLNSLADAVMYITSSSSTLDYQQLVRNALSLPLESHKNSMGAIVLAHSIISAGGKNDIPYCVFQSALFQSAMLQSSIDKKDLHSGTIVHELNSRKITKLFKK
eukprot:GFUD01082821.1.p1 GENE.GFUD01082821.1~~GFUD01082821.1.p1  ORF type:complete len:1037 (+),score=267.10 GFUD01082821.1:313-3423(+)